jgi:hypothetical protein
MVCLLEPAISDRSAEEKTDDPERRNVLGEAPNTALPDAFANHYHLIVAGIR